MDQGPIVANQAGRRHQPTPDSKPAAVSQTDRHAIRRYREAASPTEWPPECPTSVAPPAVG